MTDAAPVRKARSLNPADWANPGYFKGKSWVRNAFRIFWQLLHPPKGHRIRPTKAGITLVGLCLAIGTAAFNTSQNILYIFLAFLLSSLILSGVLSWTNFKGCRWRLDGDRRYRVGERGVVDITIENTKEHLPTYALVFELRLLRSNLEGRVPLLGRLAEKSSQVLQWSFVPRQRGREIIQLDGLSSLFPFGFLQKRIVHSYSLNAVVWPEKKAVKWRSNPMGEVGHRGSHRGQRGEGVQLHKIRSYTRGDTIRKIHWKATARAGSLMVKETETEHRPRFWVGLDPRELETSEDAEGLLAAAGSLIEWLWERGQFAGLQFGTVTEEGGTSRRVFDHAMDRLALLEPESDLLPVANAHGPALRLSGNQRSGMRFYLGERGVGEIH